MATVVRVIGQRQLIATLKRAESDLTELKDVHSAVAAFVARASEAAAPKVTGTLAASVRGNRAVRRAIVTAGRAAIPYAGPIHWGWPARNIEPNRFVWDTAEQTQEAWLNGIYLPGIEVILGKVRGA